MPHASQVGSPWENVTNMNWTNKAHLPAPLVAAITNDTYDKVGDISITGLIQPPRIRQLTIRHADKITEDVSDGIWRLIGSIGHGILERAAPADHTAEQRVCMIVDTDTGGITNG
jgi:hypothetical protein